MKRSLFVSYLVFCSATLFALPTLEKVKSSSKSVIEEEIARINKDDTLSASIASAIENGGVFTGNSDAYSNFSVKEVKVYDRLSNLWAKSKYAFNSDKAGKDIYFSIENPNGVSGKEKFQYYCTVVYTEKYLEIDDCSIYRNNDSEACDEGYIGVPIGSKYSGWVSSVYLEGPIAE